MKRTLCLLLAAFAANASAAPSTSWVEFSYGELDREWAQTPYDKGEGTEINLAAAYASSSTGYWRLDARRLSHEADVEPMQVGDQAVPGFFITPDTEIDPAAWTRAFERNIQTLTAGLRSPMNSGVDLIGEIGVVRVSVESDTLAVSTGPASSGEVERIAVYTSEHKQSGAVGRLGIIAEDGSIGWGATMEWFNKMPTGFLNETDSVRWWNAYIGYNFSPSLSLRLRYADTDDFTSKGVSLRWTL